MKIVNTKRQSYFLFTGIILPVVLIWCVVFILYFKSTSLEIVKDGRAISHDVYTDQESQGNTVARVELSLSQGLIFTYMLKEGYDFPYAGISFAPQTGLLSIDPNSIFTIELTMEAAGVIPFILNEYVKNPAGKMIIRPVQYELKTKPGTHTYAVALEEFGVPSWWYKMNHFSESDFPVFNPSSIQDICIQNSALSILNKEEGFVVREISTTPNMKPRMWLAGILSFCWVVGYVIFAALKKKKRPVFIPYIATPTEERIVDEWDLIRRYISVNYMNEIDMEGMEKELGIARHKISLLIKENTTLIFKQYLNQIKVAEAKRLLLETNLPIGEIADQVGFGHLSNFNRVFKQYAGESPSELRKQVNN